MTTRQNVYSIVIVLVPVLCVPGWECECFSAAYKTRWTNISHPTSNNNPDVYSHPSCLWSTHNKEKMDDVNKNGTNDDLYDLYINICAKCAVNKTEPFFKIEMNRFRTCSEFLLLLFSFRSHLSSLRRSWFMKCIIHTTFPPSFCCCCCFFLLPLYRKNP